MSGDEADLAGRQAGRTGSFRDEGDGSSLGDEENGIGDIIRSERAAGQADQQRSNNGRFSAAESDGERDGPAPCIVVVRRGVDIRLEGPASTARTVCPESSD